MRAALLAPLRVERLAGGAWRVLEPFAVRLEARGQEELRAFGGELVREVRVPAGFETDFASVPRVPLAFWLAGDAAHQAAVLHDWLYAEGWPRELADAAFDAAMRAEGVPWWRRGLMWAAVHLFGGAAWNAHQERRERAQAGRGDQARP